MGLTLPDALTFNTVPQVMVKNPPPPALKLFLLLLLNCSFATVLNRDVNSCFPAVLGDPHERVVW